MDEGGKITIEITISAELAGKAQNAGVDLGAIAERAIERAARNLHTRDEAERTRREVAEEVAWYNRHVEEHGLFADEWRTF